MQWAAANYAKPGNIYKSYEVVVRNRRIVTKLMEDQLHIKQEMILRIMLKVSGKSKIYAKFVP